MPDAFRVLRLRPLIFTSGIIYRPMYYLSIDWSRSSRALYSVVRPVNPWSNGPSFIFDLDYDDGETRIATLLRTAYYILYVVSERNFVT